ncbi:MAG: tRNA (guanosine(37)-N1)-methyltransferase TrmD [Anaerolineaceae bacterium]|nr:tRNA (guanosine(37)-N1)-methyltransferase TrmD [Anaerolineaceae bacterium]
MRVDLFSLFPQVFIPYLDVSIIQRAIQNGLVEIHSHDIRDWASDRHHTTDDVPYGGGGGMVLKPEPVFAAVEDILGSPPTCPLVLMTPQGRLFDQQTAFQLSQLDHLAILCGRYEGIDERIRKALVTDEISIGDYVVTGGELPALIILDAFIRLIPGALGDPDGAQDDSHASGLLEYPHYTRPVEFRGMRVPAVLQSGNHAEIASWRRSQALKRTYQRRPDLLKTASLSKKDIDYLDELSHDDRKPG